MAWLERKSARTKEHEMYPAYCLNATTAAYDDIAHAIARLDHHKDTSA